MAIASSVCIAVIVCLAVFPREFKTTDLSPVIFLLGAVLVGMLYMGNPDAFINHFAKGPSPTLMIGASMLLLFAFSRTNTIQILKKMPASAYKAVAPAAISVGILVLLVLTVIL